MPLSLAPRSVKIRQFTDGATQSELTATSFGRSGSKRGAALLADVLSFNQETFRVLQSAPRTRLAAREAVP
jgi:hypothetical protein